MLTILFWTAKPQSELVIRAFENCGSKGNLLIYVPKSVISPSSFNASNRKSQLKALKMACLSGDYMYQKLMTSCTLIDFSVNITLLKETRRISGKLQSFISSQNFSLYRRRHFPSWVRPARPFLWIACTLLMGTVTKESILVLGLKFFCFTKPQSMTNPILSIVNEVSAMLVQKTTFLMPSGVFSNTLAWSQLERAPQSWYMIIPGTYFPLFIKSSNFCSHILVADSHSSDPVKNTRMSPGPS